MTSPRAGAAAAASAAILFGTVFAATPFVLRSFDPVAGALWRAVVAFALTVPIVLVAAGRDHAYRGRPSGAAKVPPAAPPPASARVLRGIVLGLCGGPFFVAALNLAVDGAGATIGAFVTGLYAVFAALFAPLLLGERLRGTVVAGFAAALAGAALLSGLEPDPQLLGGLAFGVAAALVYALYLDLGRRWSRAYVLRPELLTLASTGTAVPLLAAWLAWTNPESIVPASVEPEALLAVVWVAAAWAFGQILIQASVRRVPAALSSAFLLLNPLTAAVLGYVVLGERLAPVQLFGGGLVLAGMALVLLVPSRVGSGIT